MKNIKLQKGFTLIEMMIAMTVFVMFMGVVMQSYLSIVTMQRESNEYRVMYSEARYIFDKFSDEVRNGTISYAQTKAVSSLGSNNPFNAVVLFSSDFSRAVMFKHNGDNLIFSEKDKNSFNMNSDRIKVKNFKIYISPLDDPYLTSNVYENAKQYQPKITVFATFEQEISGGKTLDLNLQTTISSRSYMPGYSDVTPVFGSTIEIP